MDKKEAIIIGAGIAGIASAIRLQHQGFQVKVYEMNSYPGGKLSEMNLGDYRFDCGPSLFTMPQFVEELFDLSGKNIENYFQYYQKEVVCKYFYEDQTKFTAYAKPERFAEEASEVFKVDKERIVNYFKRSKKKYDATRSLFLEKSLHKISTYLNTDTIQGILQIPSLDIYKSLDEVNRKYFEDPRLVQLFNRYATYNGSSPYLTPGIMSMVPHLEQYYGTYFPKGGMYQITHSLYQLAVDMGVVFKFDHKVDKILVENGEAKGILTDGEEVAAHIVVSNMDIVPTYRNLLKGQKSPEKILKQERSSSALIFYWGIQKEFKALDLHNIFFSEDYKTEFDHIFNKNTIYKDPTVYINITSKEEKGDAPGGCENWFVMINVPGNKGQNWDNLIAEAKDNICKKLSRLLRVDIEPLIVCEAILDPRSIESKTQSYQGSLYGSSSNNKFAAFLRHPNFSSRIKNLYFCGGSVHPGGGIPLCLLSGKIVADIVEKNEFVNS